MNTTQNLRKAVLFSLLSAASMSIMVLFVKLAAPHTNNNMTVFFRFAVSFAYILMVILFKKSQGMQFQFKTAHPWLHLFRAIASVSAMMLLYYSLKYISLVDGNLLVMTNALFVPIFAFILYRQRTNTAHWIAVILGFIGVVFVLKPDATLFHPASLIALGAGVMAAIAIMTIRAISQYDPPHTSMLYYFPLAFVISGSISIFDWETPDHHTLMLLLAVGVFGTLYQEFLIRASRYASSKLISSLLYTSIIFSGLFGAIFYKEIPDTLSLIGIVLVLAGSVLTMRFAK
ncbi:DMT family transporter [Dongshaea marina]|uniref:DMT family transporter n=1 Tax=Dongshaea marina TaxID=2047966 RepID=UPI000D3E813F|nr:DMT family transporter [Dongshaea marina]